MTTIITPQEDAQLVAAEATAAGMVGSLRQASNDVTAQLERIAFASKHGFSYGGDRDLNTALGRTDRLTIENYRARYRRGGIFKRIINAAPKATWVSGATIEEDPDPETQTKFEAATETLFKRLNIWSLLLRADILAGLGRYSALLIGGEGKAEDLEGEISFGSDGPTFLRAIAEDRAKIHEFETDTESERFGKPKIYTVTLNADSSGRLISKSREVRIHWTRIIHIVDGALESDVFGTPRGEATWDLFDDIYKVVGGGAEAAWKGMDPGLSFNIDPTLPVSPADAKKFKEEILEFQHDPRKRYLLSRGVEVDQLTPSVMNFGSNSKSLLELIAGTEEIPLRILLGTERGELASSQDERNWNKRIEERWALFAEPVVRDLVDRFIQFKALPAVAEYRVNRPVAAELDAEETASLAGKIASANKAQRDAGDTLILTSEEMRRKLYDMEPLEVSGGDPESTQLRGAAEPEGEHRAVRQAALAAEPAHEALWRGLWSELEDALPSDTMLESAIGALDAEAITVQVELEESTGEVSDAPEDLLAGPLDLIDAALAETIEDFEEPLQALLSKTLTDGAERSLEVIDTRGSYLLNGDPQFAPAKRGLLGRFRRRGAQFDAINPSAVSWATNTAAKRITEIAAGSRETVRTVIAQSLATEVSIPRAAALIRETIGLRADQARAIVRLGVDLRAASPGSTVLKGGLKFKVPQSGASNSFVKRSQARYTKRALRVRAELIRQTETANAANAGLRETWRQGREAGALPLNVKRVWIDSGDDRVRPSHAEVNGEEVGIDEDFSIGVEPGEEPRCFLPGTLVSGRFVAGLKADYSGPAREIETASGHRLRLTVNHPVLTTRGWIAAFEIETGDQVLGYAGEVVRPTGPGKPHDDDPPALIEDVFETLALGGTRAVDLHPHYLHGDARWVEGQINIVGTDRVLTGEVEPARGETGSELRLSLSDSSRDHLLVGSLGAGDLTTHRSPAPSAGGPSRSALALDSGGVLLQTQPLHALSLGPAAHWNTVKPEAAGQSVTADTQFLRELVDRSAGMIALDEVVKIFDFDFRGHVYDLQSVTGWILANGIISSNCRCGQGLVAA